MAATDDRQTSARGPYGRSRVVLAEAALRLFGERGYEATTVGDVAAAAGYAERTFFRQFASKEDVVFFDFPDLLRALDGSAHEPGAVASWPSVRDGLVENCRRWEAGGPHLAQTRTRLILEVPDLRRRFLEICAEWEDALATMLAGGADRARDPGVDAVAAQLLAGAAVAACRAAFRTWLDRPSASLEACMRATLDRLEAGLDAERLLRG